MMAAQLQQASGAASQDARAGGDAPGDGIGSATAHHAHVPATPEPVPLRNRAGDSKSPYVRTLAGTPVLWQLLDDEAVERARRENKPVFMHIGFRACHYCRLTTHESFSNHTVAALLNESFIPIAVDREERPDIDAIYWNYTQLINGGAGWPINMFLTPNLEPVFGGTYWPGPGSDVGIPDGRGTDEEGLDFVGILRKLEQSWAEREMKCRTEAKDTLLQLRKFAAEGTLAHRGLRRPGKAKKQQQQQEEEEGRDKEATVAAPPSSPTPDDLELDLDNLEEAYKYLSDTFDPLNAGFGFAPKFITTAKFGFLLRLASLPAVVRDVVGEEEVGRASSMALQTLRRIRDGALHDHLGAGFARMSTTEDWTLPHFEKMVVDNVLLLDLYLDAWLSISISERPSRSAEFADVVLELADYLTSPPILLQNGGFATSEASDSFYRRGDRHMRQGAYYTWTRREFDSVVDTAGGAEAGRSQVGRQLAADVAAAYWNVLEHGNVDRANDPNDEFINQNVLYVSKDAKELARQFGIRVDEAHAIVATARRRLAAHREKERVRPATDNKIVVCYNGMAIGALARTGAALRWAGPPGSSADDGDRYIAAARKAAAFIRAELWDSATKTLYRMYNRGRADAEGFAEDYAFLIAGLLDLYEATGEEEWLQWADELQKRQTELFYDYPDDDTTASRPRTPMDSHSGSGGFYRTTADAPHTVLRLKDGMDTTQPATNGVAASNLFRLGLALGGTTSSEEEYAHLARETIHAFEVEMLQHPWLFPSLLAEVVTARLGGQSIIIVRDAKNNNDKKEKEEEDAVLARLATLPRGFLRSLVYVDATTTTTGGEEESWLAKRNPAVAAFLKAGGREPGCYVYASQDDVWRRATVEDIGYVPS